MMSTKVANTISAFAHDENLEMLKKLKAFLEEKMDDADEVTDMIDEFTSTLSLTKVKASKKKLAGDKPKRTRKPTFYNHWLGERLRTFSAEQKDLPEDDRVGKTGRMKVIADEWKEFKKDSDAFDEAKAKWEELSSSDDLSETPKEVKKEKKEKANKPKKSKVVPEKVEDNDSDDDSDDEDNSPVAINSDSEEDDI
jgi:hypothetical protein